MKPLLLLPRFLLLAWSGPAQSLLRKKPCPDKNESLYLQVFQYYLLADLALYGTGLWIEVNPTEWDPFYRAALDPNCKTTSPLALDAQAAFKGRDRTGKVRSSLLNARFAKGASKQEEAWTHFLTETYPETRLSWLKRVDFAELLVVPLARNKPKPWICAVLKRETAHLLDQLLPRIDQKKPFYTTALAIHALAHPTSQDLLLARLRQMPVPAALQSVNGYKPRLLEFFEMEKLARVSRISAFDIHDARGNRYQLIKGQKPVLPRPAGANRKALLAWRNEELRPFLKARAFWNDQLTLRLYAMSEFPSLNRFLINQEPLLLESSAPTCDYDLRITLALLRYGADILSPAHSSERNLLQARGFNAFHLLFRLEIEPTSGGIKY